MDLPTHSLIDTGTGGVAACDGEAATGLYGPVGETGYSLAVTDGLPRSRGCYGRSEVPVGCCVPAEVVGTVEDGDVISSEVTDTPS